MADIFISYKREDQEEFGRVRPIAEALRAEGYDVFYDVQVPPGSSWEDVLQSKINAARAVIVLWSTHSVESDWVKEEAEMAKHAGKLIPVYLDVVPPPFGFARIEGANLVDWDGNLQHIEWKNLVAAIKARIGDGEKETQPQLTRVAYQPAKTVEVTKTAPKKGGGVAKVVMAMLALAVIAGLGLVGLNLVQQNDYLRDQAADAATDEAMTRGIDERAWQEARSADTIAAYRRYLDYRATGAYRREALARIDELNAAAASEPAPATPAPAQPAVPALADLTVSSLTLGSSSVVAGGDLRVQTEISNVGRTGAPGSGNDGYMVDYVLSRDGSAPVRFASFSEAWSEDALLRGGRSSNTEAIAAGASRSWIESMSIPEGWPAGRFNLCAVVDPGGKVTELSETNNVACQPIRVEPRAAEIGRRG